MKMHQKVRHSAEVIHRYLFGMLSAIYMPVRSWTLSFEAYVRYILSLKRRKK